MIISDPPPPPQHTYTLPPSACPVVAIGALAAPSLEFEVQNNKS